MFLHLIRDTKVEGEYSMVRANAQRERIDNSMRKTRKEQNLCMRSKAKLLER